MKEYAKQLLARVIDELYVGKAYSGLVVVEETDQQHGEYSSNIGMILAGREKLNPRSIADSISSQVNKISKTVTLEVAGPGFINIKFSDEYLTENVLEKKIAIPQPQSDKTVVLEFSDPNPFKQLHAGHLYTSIVGDAISRLYGALGANVYRVNFGGDVGRHVAISLYGMMQWSGGQLDYGKIEGVKKDDRPAWLSEVYVLGNTFFEKDDKAKATIHQLNKDIYAIHTNNDHESLLARVYWLTRQWSYDYFEEFYARIGLSFDKYYPESMTSAKGLQVVRDQLGNNVYEESEGAVVFKGEKYGLHTRVFINKEGLPTYEAKDVGLLFAKEQDYKPDTSVIITGNDIIEYMKVVLKSVEQYEPDISNRTLHITHGMVKKPGGVKMSSRLGNGLMAIDILTDVENSLKHRTDKNDPRVSISAVKYTFLTQKIGGDIIFDPEASVSIHGNSGPYIQYALVRAKSILAKIDSVDLGKLSQSEYPLDMYERMIIRKLGFYEDIVFSSATKMQPHMLCTYLYELAQAFNRFYENSPVIDHQRSNLRIAVVNKYTEVLEHAFTILGLDKIESM